jgi:hypothetical protein
MKDHLNVICIFAAKERKNYMKTTNDNFLEAFFDYITPPQPDLAAKQQENIRFIDTYKIFKVEDIDNVPNRSN